MRPLLENTALRADEAVITAAVNHLQETLQIRKSSPLFRLPTAEGRPSAPHLLQHRPCSNSRRHRHGLVR